MKKNLLISLIIILQLCFFQNAARSQDGCSKNYSSLVFEESSGNVLFAKRADLASYPASLTKLMTLYLTFEAIENNQLKPEDYLIFSARGEELSKVNKVTTLHIKEGDKITVRDAIRGTIVKSFNETAVTLAEAVSGSEWAFVRKMNERAKQLGMVNSSFRNSTGLHYQGQYTTSYDLARLVIALRRDFPGYYHLFSLKEFSYNNRKFETHNHVLLNYSGAEGMKTGFTNASGFNLVAAAKKDNKRIISILMGCATHQKRDNFTKKIFDYAFEDLKKDKESEIALISLQIK